MIGLVHVMDWATSLFSSTDMFLPSSGFLYHGDPHRPNHLQATPEDQEIPTVEKSVGQKGPNYSLSKQHKLTHDHPPFG